MEDLNSVTLICPTRKRPHNVRRLIKSVEDTSSGDMKVIIKFYVDDDDETLEELRAIKVSKEHVNVEICVGPRILMCEMSNVLARKSEEGILFFCGDDIVMESQDWDTEVKGEFEKCEDRILLVYGDDGLQGRALATHFFLHTNWVKTLGYMVPPLFPGDWVDTYVTHLSTMLGRRVYRDNIKTIHYHPDAGKAPIDDTYTEKYQRDAASNARHLFASSQHLRESDCVKLRKFINEQN